MDGKNVKTPSLRVPMFIGTKQSLIPCNKIIFFQLLLITLFCCCFTAAVGQRQLIVLKNEEVLARYQKGDVIHFAREQDKEILIQRILDLNDTLLMMNFDTVAYYRIKKLDLQERRKVNYLQKLGAYMMVAGVILPVAELINTGIVQDQGASLSSGVAITSAILVGGGAALYFIKKPYFKPGRKYHLMIVDSRSPFYKAKPVAEGYLSPYIPRN